MRENIEELVENLESLRFDSDFNFDGGLVELTHDYNVNYNKTYYSLLLEIRRPRHTFNIDDRFLIVIHRGKIVIDYCRDTESIMPFVSKPIPDRVEKKFHYDLAIGQDKIFRTLLKDINILFSEYNYIDQHYDMISNIDEEDEEEDD